MIVIDAYNPAWPIEFERLRSSLRTILGPLTTRIDHIGSTSVPGLGAKDVIDIQVTVRELEPEITRRLAEAGYTHCDGITHDHVPCGEDDTPALWAKLVFNEPRGERRANVHVRKEGNPNQRYPLLFRDYLRAHPNSARTIERIKRELVKRHADDIDAYYDIKDPVYDLIWDAALEWAQHTGWDMTTAIRPFQDEDEPAVVGVWHRSGLAAYRYLPTWQSLTLERAGHVFREVIRPRCDIWVGTRNEQVVAFLAMAGSYIDRMYVDPSEWRKGWGTRFVLMAKTLRPEGLELHTHQENHAARALYERHGFRVVKFGLSPPPESAPDVEYHWRPDALR